MTMMIRYPHKPREPRTSVRGARYKVRWTGNIRPFPVPFCALNPSSPLFPRLSLAAGCWLLAASVFFLVSCSSPSPQSKPNEVAQSTTEFPWHIGVFQGEGRTKLALLPDGTMIFPPLYLGTYTFSNGDLTFTSSNKETTKKGKFTNSKEGLQLTLDERSYLLKSAVSFSRYSSSGAPLDVTPAALVGTWKKIAQSGAPLSDWQRASEALGPSLATEETLAFAASNQLTQTIGGTSRKETFTLTGGTIVRSPEIAGYQLTQDIRLYADRLELGPKESPDVYVKSNTTP
jgi:hypothetical protein